MAEKDDNDIIIAIVSSIRLSMGMGEFSIDFPTIEQTRKLPEGSVAKHLEQAASDLGLEVVRKGSSSAWLRKKAKAPPLA